MARYSEEFKYSIMAKKIVIGVFSLLLLTGIVSGVLSYKANNEVTANNNEKVKLKEEFKAVGQGEKAISQNPNKNEPVIKIGDSFYTFETVSKKMQNHKVNNPNITLDEIINSLKTEEVLIKEAKKRNIYPSNEDVKNYMIRERKSIEQSSNPEVFYAYVEGLGISVDEYWSTWAVPI